MSQRRVDWFPPVGLCSARSMQSNSTWSSTARVRSSRLRTARVVDRTWSTAAIEVVVISMVLIMPRETPFMGRLDDRAAVITGASGGIGWATTRKFVAEGAKVVAVDIDVARGAEMVEEIGADHVTFVEADVRSSEQVRAAVDRCVADHGRIDVLFNNAATSTGGYVADLDLDGFDDSIKLMLNGPLHGMQAAIPHMIEQGGGSIINTSSVYGLVAGAANAPYCAAKAGLINLSRVTAVEYGRKGIRCNAICPGVVETPMFEAVLGIGLKTREEVAAMHAIGRTIRPEEVADLVLFLASDESTAITGQAIQIDGGLLCETNFAPRP
jgi:meso-butanediol dehydrogenase/(S,S)-butanediol dehydrogenase/diacetyl reductase